MSHEVEVWMSLNRMDVRVGSLYSTYRRGRTATTFTYEDRFIGASHAFPLEPALPLEGGAHHVPGGKELFNAFSDAAPDRWGRRLIERRHARECRGDGRATGALSEIDFLMGVTDQLRQGALRFRYVGESTFSASHTSGVPQLVDLPLLLRAAEGFEKGDEAADIAALEGAGSSLGGTRPKVHVQLPTGIMGIAKFPSSVFDTWNVPAWEHITLSLARRAGLNASVSELHRFAGLSVVILNRFDRTGEDQRVPYMSALTALEANDGDTASYLDIAEVVEEESPSPTRDLQELWRRIVFMALVSNTDDHLRNHGFLRRGAGWSLCPMFDVNPDPNRHRFTTAINDSERDPGLDLMLDVAALFRIEDPIQEAVRLRAITKGWRAVAARNGLGGPAIAAMQPAFDSPFAREVDAASP